MRTQVVDLGFGRDKKIYVLPDGHDLIGESIWLRAEEIGGDRILNHRLKVEN